MVQTRASSHAPTQRPQSEAEQGRIDTGGPSQPVGTPGTLGPKDDNITQNTVPSEVRPSIEDAASKRRRIEQISKESEELDQLIEEARLKQEVAAKRARLELLLSGAQAAEITPEVASAIAPEGAPISDEARIDPVVVGPAAPAYASHTPLYRPAALPHPIYSGTSHTDLRTFLFDLEDQFRLQANQLRTDTDRISYAVRCVSGDPKQAWINYVQQQKGLGVDQESITWQEFRDFLEDQIWADPTTRAITSGAQLAKMFQGTHEPVQAFLRRYENAEMESPYPQSDAQRVHYVLGKLRPSIGTAISAQATLPRTWHELTSLARRIESTQQLAAPTRQHDGRQCFNCKKYGHVSANCPEEQQRPRPAEAHTTNQPTTTTTATTAQRTDERRCYNCKELGHISRHCPNAPAQRPNDGNLQCYSCGELGHIAPNCPKKACRKCGELGHTALRCEKGSSNNEPLGQRKS